MHPSPLIENLLLSSVWIKPECGAPCYHVLIVSYIGYMREKTLRVRMNQDEWDILQSLADKESLPIPEYIRFLIRKLNESDH